MPKEDVGQLAAVVGQAIAKRRLVRGLTQEQLSERLGIGNEALSRIERGVVPPTVTRLEEIAGVLECGVLDLMYASNASTHEQAHHLLTHVLPQLSDHDQAMVLDMVERLAAGLLRR
jgi:transcriptional regulator with XRE-family HTH domain